MALLLSGAGVLTARPAKEVIVSRKPLSSFPRELGPWVGTDVPIDEETRNILGAGDFLVRFYDNPSENVPPVDLFIAYFPSQRTGDTIHSPKHCLPGAGWRPVESSRVTLSFPGRAPFPANRYVIARREQRQVVLYWYQAHDRALASEYWAKFYLIADAIRMNRTDGSLIRVVTPIANRERVADAESRALSVAGRIMPVLDEYVPR
jgi:EpsI family protein